MDSVIGKPCYKGMFYTEKYENSHLGANIYFLNSKPFFIMSSKIQPQKCTLAMSYKNVTSGSET